jgi:hypothetical protein
LLRVCKGWVATREASQLSVIAIAQRGKLTGSSALYSREIWDGVNTRIQIRRRPNSHGEPRRLATPIAEFVPPRHSRVGIDTTWSTERFVDEAEPPWRVSIIDALLDVARQVARDQFLACIESAVRRGAMSRAALPVLLGHLPERLRFDSALLDFSADSGIESLARIRLAPLVQSMETQVRIPGISRAGGDGRVDLLLDKWLVIELDGDEWHDPAADRLRNQVLVQQGFRSHRFGHRQVIHGWPDVEATVRELLRYPPSR